MPAAERPTVKEAIERETAPESGARIIQMTNSDLVSDVIYSEISYADASSRYFMFHRRADRAVDTQMGPAQVWRGDLVDRSLTLVDDDTIGLTGVGMSRGQRDFYCIKQHTPEALTLLRIEIASLEQETVTFSDTPVMRVGTFMSLTPDDSGFVLGVMLAPHHWGIIRCDWASASSKLIHEGGDDIFGAHAQIEPARGQDIMIQHNRGAILDDTGRWQRKTGPEGATLYLIDIDGGNLRRLPVGKPYTAPIQGHQVWLGTTGKILLTVAYEDEQEARAQGILRVLHPGDSESRVLTRGYLFDHPSLSSDARFFVSETFDKPSLITVGSIGTGKVRVLCNSGSVPQDHYGWPEPYFTPDRRWVIFNSERTGSPQIYAASVPDGFLDELEED